jgi:hypothetical protein
MFRNRQAGANPSGHELLRDRNRKRLPDLKPIKRKLVIDGLFSFSGFVSRVERQCPRLFLSPLFEVTPMLVQFFQWIKRLSTGTSSQSDENYSQSFSNEDHDVGRWTFMSVFIVLTLSLYIVAGLGYYAKVHVWDGMTDEQKAAVAQAMVVDTQYL